MEQSDKLVKASETPDVKELQSEYRRSIHEGFTSERLSYSDKHRLAKWSSQSDDFKKHSEYLSEGGSAFPWEGAADTRQRLIDTTIRNLLDILMVAFNRSQVKINPVETGDLEASTALNQLFRWLVGSRLYNELQREAELFGEYALTYGFSVMFVGWEQSSALKLQDIKLEQLLMMAQEADPNSLAAELPELIQNPEAEDQAAELFKEILGVKKSRARKMIRELRNTGETQFPTPYTHKNQPTVVALKPYEDVSFPPETLDLQKARVIFRRVYMTELELRAKVGDDGWSEEFVEAAINTAGKTSESLTRDISVNNLITNEADSTENLVEVIYAYTKQLNEDDIPGVYCTIFNAYATGDGEDDIYAKHELLDYAHCMYPFVEFRRERPARRAISESRGVAEISACHQAELKAQRDSIIDRTALETIPPVQYNRRLGMANHLGPAVMVPVHKPGDYMPLQLTAGVPATSMSVIELILQDVAEYYGLAHPNIPPGNTTMKQQATINSWLSSWTEIYQQMLVLTLQYLEGDDLTRILGFQLPQMDLDMMPDFILKFDARDLNDDYVMKKLEIIAQQLLPMDAGGSIERNALMSKMVRSIAPDLADEILIDQGSASQKIFDEVKGEVGGMMLGNEATYRENDPSAQTRLQYFQEIVQRNPKAQQAAGEDEQVAALFQNYQQNLEMSLQQQQNAQIGRIGVKQVQ